MEGHDLKSLILKNKKIVGALLVINILICTTAASNLPQPLLVLTVSSVAMVISRSAMASQSAKNEVSLHRGHPQGHLSPHARKFHVAPEEHLAYPVHGTYPRLCRLSDGSILLGSTAFGPDGQRVLSVSRSVDEGRTFHPHGEVARCRGGDCDNLFLLETPAAAQPESSSPAGGPTTVLAAFRNHDLSPSGRPTHFRITVCRSADGGRSWAFLSQAFEKPAPMGLWEPFLRLAGDGREIQLFFSRELEAADQDTMLVRSADGGRTWSSPPVCVTGAGERLRDGMVGIAATRRVGKGRGEEALVMVMETTRRGTFSIECVMSHDGGLSWGSRQVVYEASPGRNAGAPQVASFADGSVAVVFMTDEDGPGGLWPRGSKVKVVFSGPPDEAGFRWTSPQVVGETGSSWPGVMRVTDSAVLVVYEFSSSIRGRMLNFTK